MRLEAFYRHRTTRLLSSFSETRVPNFALSRSSMGRQPSPVLSASAVRLEPVDLERRPNQSPIRVPFPHSR
jgi:hypothetical protein